MSYIDELNALVEKSKSMHAGEEPIKFDPTEVYASLFDMLQDSCVWVKFNTYNEIEDMHCRYSMHKDVYNFVARIDLRHAPLVTVRSTKLFDMVFDLCSNTSVGYLDRAIINSDLDLHYTKCVLLAGLKPFDKDLRNTFPRRLVSEAQAQHRCVVFPLSKLVSKAGLDMSDVVSDANKLFE